MPSSYDLLVWHAAIVDGKMVQFDDFLDIKPREFALLSTKEHIELPLDIAGRLFLRSYLSRMGIFPESQGRVEAGYKGTVTLPIVNMNKNSVRISVDEPIVSIEFERLSKSVMRGYSGKYQGSEGPVQ
jgi:dCTP deaminase